MKKFLIFERCISFIIVFAIMVTIFTGVAFVKADSNLAQSNWNVLCLIYDSVKVPGTDNNPKYMNLTSADKTRINTYLDDFANKIALNTNNKLKLTLKKVNSGNTIVLRNLEDRYTINDPSSNYLVRYTHPTVTTDMAFLNYKDYDAVIFVAPFTDDRQNIKIPVFPGVSMNNSSYNNQPFLFVNYELKANESEYGSDFNGKPAYKKGFTFVCAHEFAHGIGGFCEFNFSQYFSMVPASDRTRTMPDHPEHYVQHTGYSQEEWNSGWANLGVLDNYYGYKFISQILTGKVQDPNSTERFLGIHPGMLQYKPTNMPPSRLLAFDSAERTLAVGGSMVISTGTLQKSLLGFQTVGLLKNLYLPSDQIEYTSSNSNIASITTAMGGDTVMINGVSPGIATITAKLCYFNGSGQKVTGATATIKFNVKNITLNVPQYINKNFAAAPLMCAVSLSQTDNTERFDFHSSNTSIVVVTAEGRIDGVKAGSTKIRVCAAGLTKYVDVNVYN